MGTTEGSTFLNQIGTSGGIRFAKERRATRRDRKRGERQTARTAARERSEPQHENRSTRTSARDSQRAAGTGCFSKRALQQFGASLWVGTWLLHGYRAWKKSCTRDRTRECVGDWVSWSPDRPSPTPPSMTMLRVRCRKHLCDTCRRTPPRNGNKVAPITRAAASASTL